MDCGKIKKNNILSIFNELGSYYNVGRRSRKRWKHVFAYGIECCVSNAYVLDKFAKPIEHAHSGRSKRDYFAFRYELKSVRVHFAPGSKGRSFPLEYS